MKRRKFPLTSRKLLGLAFVGVAVMRSADAATLIDFEGLPHNTDILQTFADNVTATGTGFSASVSTNGFLGTPNIGLTWGSGAIGQVDSYQSWDGRSTVAQLDFTRPASFTPISLTFTPDAGYGVLISSFYMDLYSGGGPMNVDWNISDGLGTLASGTWTRASGGRDQIVTGLGAGNINAGQIVTLTFTRNAGLGDYFAIDGLSFDQVQAVPEPSTAALAMLGGIGILAMRRRK